MSEDVLALEDIDIKGIEEHPETESVLLHGPPGTGKTTAAAARVGLLIRDHDYSIGDVAWATYRRSLAEETLDRLAAWDLVDDDLLDDPANGATRFISTIHAIANRAVGGLPDPVEPGHRVDFCKKQGIRYKPSTPFGTTPGKELFKAFDWLKTNCYDPADPNDLANYPHLDTLRDQFGGAVAEMWGGWENYKERKGRIDFHEQLERALEENAHPGTPILVIDEFHDATPIMARVAEMWMQNAEIVIVAGDPHQVVNSYQGASPYFFERLEGRYPKILLDKSWRLGDDIWQGATALLSHAHEPPAVETSGESEILEYRSGTFESEPRGGWRTPPASQPGSPPAMVEAYGPDVMFLARTRKQVDGIGAVLEKAGILYRSQTELGGWNTERGATRLRLHNALQKIRGVTPDAFEQTAQSGLRSYDDGRAPPDEVYLSAEETYALLKYAQAEHLAESRRATEEWINGVQNAEVPQSLADINEHVEPSFWGVYSHGAASETKLNKGARSDRERTALQKALQAHESPVDPAEIPATIMTIHASKGFEASDVVLYDGIPSTVKEAMRVSERERKNEWRTWYVGVTRAFDRVHIMRDGFGWCSKFLPDDIRRAPVAARLEQQARETAATDEVTDHV